MQNDGESCAHAAPTPRPVRPRPGCIPAGCLGGVPSGIKPPPAPGQQPSRGQQPGRAKQPGRRPPPVTRPGPVPTSSLVSSPGSSPGSPPVSITEILRPRAILSPGQGSS
uniref:Uncharacterized protein n=1 Tax=Rhipicephalus zambeziensis TaxID=60191 RepID=A0A224YKD8_9ACAR